jgi:hypothetical protein
MLNQSCDPDSGDSSAATAVQPGRDPSLPPEYPNQLLHTLEIARLYLILPIFFELGWRLRIDPGQKFFVGLCFIGAASKHLMRSRFKVDFGRRDRFGLFPEAFRLNGQQAPHFQEDGIFFTRVGRLRQPDVSIQSDTLILPNEARVLLNEARGGSLMSGGHIARIQSCETMARPAGWAIFMVPARDAA